MSCTGLRREPLHPGASLRFRTASEYEGQGNGGCLPRPVEVRILWRISFQETLTHGSLPMTYIMVDIEADGPIPGDYSMVCFGAIVVEPSLDRTFYGKLKPISEKWIPEALQVSGFSREETMAVR